MAAEGKGCTGTQVHRLAHQITRGGVEYQSENAVATADGRQGVVINTRFGNRPTAEVVGIAFANLGIQRNKVVIGLIENQSYNAVAAMGTYQRVGIDAGIGKRLAVPCVTVAFAYLSILRGSRLRIDGQAQSIYGVAADEGIQTVVVNACVIERTAVPIVRSILLTDSRVLLKIITHLASERQAIDGVAAALRLQTVVVYSFVVIAFSVPLVMAVGR